MNKGNYLFDMAKLVKRPLPEQREFEIEHYDFLIGLPNKIDLAFAETQEAMKQKHPLSINRNWFANTMNGNILYHVGIAFAHFLRSSGRGSYYLLMDYKYEVYLKKLNDRLFPSYNHSRSSRALTNQQATPYQDPIPVVYIGYTVNKTKDKITGYYAVCIQGSERLWKTDLTAIEPPQVMDTTQQNQPKTPTVTVTIKGSKKKAK